jgi:rubrerythrin
MFKHLRTMLSLVMPTIVSSESVAVKESTSTVDNLQIAFNGESNANARYLAFAKKADEEGFGEVASLFHAAAKAEEIHARNHSDVLRKMGATPGLNLEPIELKTTHENLKAAIAGEKYERDIMYPEFIEVAERETATAALRTFTYALKVEAVHAVLYQDALDHLKQRTGKNHTYYVCPDCGNTLDELTILKCMVCGHRQSDFIAVS